MTPYPLVWIVMGVAGSGKSTVGRRLAAHLDCDFLEADRRHPTSNIRRMQQDQPLQGRQHFFGPELLSSQLRAFEDPQPEEPLWQINGVGDPETIAQRILEQSRRRWPVLQQPWWQRQEHN
ncbi:MAG: AAA family ATPase [Synechococcaceae cyanobacterium SM2_3_1]|nr:AAA family ATPase [Synechococcaceae cyanobacterium SM2_3_1]